MGGRGGVGRRPRCKPRLRSSPGLGFPNGDERACLIGSDTERLAERAASVETQQHIADSLASGTCQGRTGLPERTRSLHLRLRTSSRAGARRSEVSVEALRGYSMDGSSFKSPSPSRIRPSLATTAERSRSGILAWSRSAAEGSGRTDSAAGVIAERRHAVSSRR
jgi:hypothetical protein